MATKKYVSLSKLSTFLDNLKNTFAQLSHKHTISDLTDYTVDSELSSTSVNPLQNKVINAEFDAVATAMNVLESTIDAYHDDMVSGDSSTLESSKTYTDNAVAQKSQVQIITWEDGD